MVCELMKAQYGNAVLDYEEGTVKLVVRTQHLESCCLSVAWLRAFHDLSFQDARMSFYSQSASCSTPFFVNEERIRKVHQSPYVNWGWGQCSSKYCVVWFATEYELANLWHFLLIY